MLRWAETIPPSGCEAPGQAPSPKTPNFVPRMALCSQAPCQGSVRTLRLPVAGRWMHFPPVIARGSGCERAKCVRDGSRGRAVSFTACPRSAARPQSLCIPYFGCAGAASPCRGHPKGSPKPPHVDSAPAFLGAGTPEPVGSGIGFLAAPPPGKPFPKTRQLVVKETLIRSVSSS